MKEQLFELTQFCHDHSEEFTREFMSKYSIEEIDQFYFSGSKVLVLYTDNDLVRDNMAYFKTSDVLWWVGEATNTNEGVMCSDFIEDLDVRLTALTEEERINY